MSEEGHAGPPVTPPSWLPIALGGFVAGFVVPIFTTVAYAAVTGDSQGLGAVLAAQAGFWAGLSGAVVVASRRAGTGSLRDDVGFRLRPLDVPLGVVIGLVSQLLVVPLVELPFQRLDPSLGRKVEKITSGIFHNTSGGRFALFSAVIVLGAGFVEELFFRGLLQTALTRRLGPVWGIGLASLVFALSHFQPIELPALTAFGVVLGILYQRTGRLGPAIVAHLTFDALATVQYAVSHHLFR